MLEGLGCCCYLGCPGITFILCGQLQDSEKRSPYLQGWAVLLFVISWGLIVCLLKCGYSVYNVNYTCILGKLI